VSDANQAEREAARAMVDAADTIITAAVQASEMIFEKHGPDDVDELDRVATIAKFVFMTAAETTEDHDFLGVVAARAMDRMIQGKLAAK
jgi:hypothetical protein